MAKAKQKRVKKELEKLQRGGRHLEWLAEVQGQPVTAELKREMDQAWREVQRRTLRTKPAFDEFCARMDRIEAVPKNPEMDFLLALRDLAKGADDAAEKILAATGLSGAYQTAQENLRAAMQSPRDWQAIEVLLDLMARDPGKITRKQYQNLAGHFAATLLEQSFLVLGEGMAVFRRLNHKANLHRPLSPKLLDDLHFADHQLGMATGPMPPALRHLVLLPFAFQVLLYLRQCTPAPVTHQVQELIQSVEQTFMLGAGNLLPSELRDRLFAWDEDELTDTDLGKMERDFSSASFEGKLALLRDLRQAFHRASSSEMGDNPFFSGFFEDDTETMERLLFRFHKQVLKEIGRRLPGLASRERRALVAVIDPILAQDVSDLLAPAGEGQALIDLLLQAAEAGCLSTRLSLLALLVAQRDRSKRLGPHAVTALQEAPLPGLADLRWLMNGHGPLAVRSPAVFKVLFEKIRGNNELVRYLAEAVWNEVNTGIMVNALAPDINPLMRRFGLSDPSLELFTPAVMKELAELASQVPELEPLRHFLTVFPDGRISAESLRQWFEAAWMREGDCALFIETVQALIAGAEESSVFWEIFGDDGPGCSFAATANRLNFAKVVIDFLRDNAGDFRRLSLQAVGTIVEEIFPHLEKQSDYGSLLIRTYNALCDRVAAGEKEFAALRDRLDSRLRALAGGNRGRGRSSRR